MEITGKKTVDRTVIQNTGLCCFGHGANTTAFDVKDGRVVRVRPVHYDRRYTKEDINYWTIEGQNGQTFEPGMKSSIPPFAFASKTTTYSNNRVPYPLIRVDWDPNGERHPENRGKSKYRRISWDEALDICASEIKRIQDKYSFNAILAQADGHGETKSIHGPHGCMCKMLDITGGYALQARQPDSWEGWYWGAKHVWGNDPVGQNRSGYNIIEDIMQHGDAVLLWGCDFETTPWGWGGCMPSRISFKFTDCGIWQIAIAPDCNYAAAIHADRWIPVLPNTDAAMQLAIAYVWLTEDTYDKEYLATHADGFDWFSYYVLGEEDGVPKTPEWAEEKCGVPAYTIKALARYWAQHNVSIGHCNGGGMVRAAFSHEPARLEVYLLGMQAVGHPGRNQFKFLEWALFGSPSSNPLPIGLFLPMANGCYNGNILGELPPVFIPKTMIPAAIRGEKLSWFGRVTCTQPRLDQFDPYQYPIEGDEDCTIHMIWSDSPCWSTCWNGGNEFEDALRHPNLEFFLVQHPWMENDCLFADIILPASTKLELTDFNTDAMNGQFCTILYERAAIDPVGDSKSDWDIVCEICKKLEKYGGRYENLYEKYTEGKPTDVDELVKKGYMECGGTDDWLDWEDFKEHDYQIVPTYRSYEKMPWGMINFYEDPEGHPLETPTGKIEYYSVPLAEAWPDDHIRGPVAHWIEKGDGHDDRKDSPRAKDYPYLLVSNHPRWRVHANLDDVPWFREIETCKVIGPDGYAYEPVWVNPIDAEREGLQDGDIVTIFNERGAVMGGVRLTERIMPGAISQDHGTHVDPIVRGYGGLDRGGANNLIAPSAVTSKNAVGEVTAGYLVGIKKVDVFEIAEKYGMEVDFERDHYTSETGMCVQDIIVDE
ncbi:MAG: molybdopterin-dependent oxidoreductase [Coriobacteriales bacterium]|jgi:anaerobic selenocysteine-containing dehydrogenase